jgi:hypothetical protein
MSSELPQSPCERVRQSTFFWGCAGAVLAIVLTVVAAMAHDIRWLLGIAWPFAMFAIWEFARTWFAKRVHIVAITGAGMILSGLLLGCLYRSLSPTETIPPVAKASQPPASSSMPSPGTISVYPDFLGTYTKYKDRLGAPKFLAVNSSGSPNHPTGGAAEAWTENSFVIWMQNPGIMCAFQTESGHHFKCTTGALHAHSNEPELWDEKYIKRSLHLRNNDYWPVEVLLIT